MTFVSARVAGHSEKRNQETTYMKCLNCVGSEVVALCKATEGGFSRDQMPSDKIQKRPPLPPTPSGGKKPGGSTFKGSAAAADPLAGEVPLGADMTLRGKKLECQNWVSWGFPRPGTFQKRFAVKNYIEWLIWLFLVILWNYGYPEATPFYDVLVAVILSIIFIIIKKYRN